MFATFADQKHGLGTAVLVSDSPMGPFSLWSDGYVTPKECRCLDGTLFIEDGTPYMVYCHEWREIHDGTICAVKLSEDLKESVGKPFVLFSASKASGYVKKYFFRNYITDGPFLIHTDDGRLHMLWSTNATTGYVEALAHSNNNKLHGKWSPDNQLLYERDGGHGMIFMDLEGNYRLALHYPNTFGKEHPVFIDVCYADGKWKLKKE